jgi:hypothetical protein
MPPLSTVRPTSPVPAMFCSYEKIVRTVEINDCARSSSNCHPTYAVSNHAQKRELVHYMIGEIRLLDGRLILATRYTAWPLERTFPGKGRVTRLYRCVATLDGLKSKSKNSRYSRHRRYSTTPVPTMSYLGEKEVTKGTNVYDYLSKISQQSTIRRLELEIAASVVEDITNSGSRFLQEREEDDRWEEVPNNVARNKICRLAMIQDLLA